MRLFFTVLFLLIILTPVVFFNYKEEYSYREKRPLAPFPGFFQNGKINTKIFRRFDEYMEDRIGLKSLLVGLNSRLVYEVLNKTKSDRVVLGKNDWLFYIFKADGDNLSDFLKTNLFTDTEISALIRQINDRKTWCEQNGIRFVFFISPNKHNIYPEYYPVRRPEGEHRTENFLKKTPREIKDHIVYPKEFLLSKKGDNLLYYENDTHWNKLGAYYSSSLLSGKITSYFPDRDFPNVEYTVTKPGGEFSGDLPPMLGLGSNKFRGTYFSVEPALGQKTFYTYLKNDGGTNDIVTKGTDDQLPKALVFRDSFYVALEPFTSCLFSEAVYRWKLFDESDKEDILKNKPDIIIWEMVERNLHAAINSQWN
jgi:hypothetical protein